MSSPPVESVTTPTVENSEAEMIWYEAARHRNSLNWHELWRYRELLGTLTMRDLKVRYRQAYVGIAWAMLQPLVTMIIFTTLFVLLGRTPAKEGVPYPIVVFCGLLPWLLIAGSVTKASLSLVSNQHLITKVYFPRAALPIAVILAHLVDFIIGFGILGLMMAWYGMVPPIQILLFPVFILMTLMACFSISLWLSAANGLYRDVGHIVPFLIQIGFFVSPVIYESGSLIGDRFRWLYQLNPMVGILEGFRWSVIGHTDPPWEAIAYSLAGLILLTWSGMAYFRRVERIIADRI